MVLQLNKSEDGGVDVRGQMLTNEKGIYAARIAAVKNMKKDVKLVGPSNIQFDRNAMMYIVTMEGPVEDVFNSQEPKLLELYVRKKPETIPYG